MQPEIGMGNVPDPKLCAVCELAIAIRAQPEFAAGSSLDYVSARGLGAILTSLGEALHTDPDWVSQALGARLENLFLHLQQFVGEYHTLFDEMTFGILQHLVLNCFGQEHCQP
jgi:hypothetical protein